MVGAIVGWPLHLEPDMDYENCVQAFFCESKRLAEEPLPREFTGPDGRRYALVPVGEEYIPPIAEDQD